MGKDVNGFCTILRAAGHVVQTERITAARPSADELAEPARQEVLELYRALGGKRPELALRPGPWDIFVDGVLIELDEQLHFNEYRAVTLASPWYAEMPWFPLTDYRRFCIDHAMDCLAHGRAQGRWMNPSTEKHFGPSAPRGDLSSNGSSRWKQRALYDFIKDVAGLVGGLPPLARISIWDAVPGTDGRTIEAAVNGDVDPALGDGLWELVLSRARRT